MRGDVPLTHVTAGTAELFSPHARGCSAGEVYRYPEQGVFPACAGMFHNRPLRQCGNVGFPRMRGDVPFTVEDLTASVVFSPHARGCSYEPVTAVGDALVFPACAGMFLDHPDSEGGGCSFPRMRGDVPLLGMLTRHGFWVFPACAGMFRTPLPCEPEKLRSIAAWGSWRCSFPRMRGDVPLHEGHLAGPL